MMGSPFNSQQSTAATGTGTTTSSMNHTSRTTTVSAPGKVLLAGGYLVLESPNVGLVVATNSRFYTTVETSINSTSTNGTAATNPQNTSVIVVSSPQFHTSWTYTLMVGSEDHVSFLGSAEIALIPSSSSDDAGSTNANANPFVEKTLRVVLAYLFQRFRDQKKRKNGNSSSSLSFPPSIQITIKADNDFYSVIPHLEGRPRRIADVEALPKFLPCPVDPSTGKAIVNKTGLGSSASLVTSLVGALFYHFQSKSSNDQKEPNPPDHESKKEDDGDDDDDEEEEEELDTQQIIHNLAQLCHCHAQGKVGSGFDVSAAIHGTHVYRRFPKCILPDVLNQLSDESNHHHLCNHNDPTTNVNGSTAELLTNVVHSTWSENMQTPLVLPPGLQLLLADVCGGSESPGMARKVLTWKQQHIQQGTLKIPHWSNLKDLNAKIVELMQTLSTSSTPIDTDALSQLPATQWQSDDENSPTYILRQLHDTLLETRTHLRELGDASQVPIEPPEQTQLCDATMALPGVVAALVPGAGGYDAVACLYIETPQVKKAIGQFWETWENKGQELCALSVRATSLGLQLEEEEEKEVTAAAGGEK